MDPRGPSCGACCCCRCVETNRLSCVLCCVVLQWEFRILLNRLVVAWMIPLWDTHSSARACVWITCICTFRNVTLHAFSHLEFSKCVWITGIALKGNRGRTTGESSCAGLLLCARFPFGAIPPNACESHAFGHLELSHHTYFTLRVFQMRVIHTHLEILPQKGVVVEPLGILLRRFVVVCMISLGQYLQQEFRIW